MPAGGSAFAAGGSTRLPAAPSMRLMVPKSLPNLTSASYLTGTLARSSLNQSTKLPPPLKSPPTETVSILMVDQVPAMASTRSRLTARMSTSLTTPLSLTFNG